MIKRNLAVALVVAVVLIMSVLPVYAAQPTVAGKYLDSFDRDKLAVDASNNTLSDGTTIYWNQSGAGTFAISDGILNAKMDKGGYFRFATNNSDEFKYVIIRIKGDKDAVNDKIYTRLGVAENKDIDDGSPFEKAMSDLKGPDGKAIPAITSDWQDIVIDMAKNGLKFGGGSNAFQIGSWQAMNLNIDYIFMTNELPAAAAKAVTAKTATATDNPKTGDSTPIAAALAVIAGAAVILVVLSRKKTEC
jgi:LPXTG-motif cell wall-anchored protein